MASVDRDRVGTATGEDGTPRLLVRSGALRDGGRMLTSQLSNAMTGLRVSVEHDSRRYAAG